MTIAALLSAAALTSAPAAGPVLLDARCEAAEYAGAARHDLGGGVALLARHDRDYVYLCLTLPPGSLGTLDVYIQPAPDGPLHNLHVSAQVGERTRGPAGWPDWRFGNEQGWYGPAVEFRGMARAPDGGLSPDFEVSEGRELQLSRKRFGAGPWKVRFEVNALGADSAGAVTFPAGSKDDDPQTWTSLTFTG